MGDFVYVYMHTHPWFCSL